MNLSFLIVSGFEHRFSMLLGTLGSLLPNVTDKTFFIGFQYELTEEQERILKWYKILAKRYGNILRVYKCNKDDSLILAKLKILKHVKSKWVWFLDDDISISTKSIINILTSIKMFSFKQLFVLEFVDIDDTRGHKDYDLTVRNSYDIEDFVKEFGAEKIIHHRWKEGVVLEPARIKKDGFSLGGMFIIDRVALLSSPIIDKLKKLKKGERGYDVILCTHFFNEALLLLGYPIWHCGLEPFFNDLWKGISNETKKLVVDTKKELYNEER